MPHKRGAMDANLRHCRKSLKQYDYPRYALSLTLPSPQREQLWVLGALNVEASRAAEMSEPATGAIRLKWWQEALTEPRNHPVANAWHALSLEPEVLLQAIESREVDLQPGYHFQTIRELDDYALKTGRFWRLLAAEDEAQQAWLEALGQCWVLQGLLWATGYALSRGYTTLPQEVVAAHGINPLEQPDEAAQESLHHIIQTLARRVEETLKRVPIPPKPMLSSASKFIHWRCHKMRNTPQIALQTPPPESRLKLLWKMVV